MLFFVRSDMGRRDSLLALLIVSGAVVAGIGIPWMVNSGTEFWVIPVVLLSLVSLLAYLLHPRFIVRFLLFLSITSTSLGIYEVRLLADQNLQLMRAVLLIAVLAWFPLNLRKGLRISATTVLTAVLAGYAALSTALFSKNVETSVSLTVALGFGCVYLIWLPNVIRGKSMIRLAKKGLFAASLVLIAFGIYQYASWFTGFGLEGYQFSVPFSDWLGMETTSVLPSRIGSLFRVTLPYSSSSIVAPNVAAILLIMLALRTGGITESRRVWFSSIIISSLLVLLFVTYSRAAWLGFLVGVLAIAWYQKNNLTGKQLWSILIFLAILSMGVLFLAPEILDTIADRFNPALTENSDRKHGQFIVTATQLWLDQPLKGHGIGNYEYLTGIRHAHNLYVTALAEGGLFYLILILGLITSVVFSAHRTIRASHPKSEIRALTIGLLAAYLAFLVDNIFQVTWYVGALWMIVGLIIALSFVVRS